MEVENNPPRRAAMIGCSHSQTIPPGASRARAYASATGARRSCVASRWGAAGRHLANAGERKVAKLTRSTVEFGDLSELERLSEALVWLKSNRIHTAANLTTKGTGNPEIAAYMQNLVILKESSTEQPLYRDRQGPSFAPKNQAHSTIALQSTQASTSTCASERTEGKASDDREDLLPRRAHGRIRHCQPH